jgi:hypothetical protein
VNIQLSRRKLLGAAAGLFALPVACGGDDQVPPEPTRTLHGDTRPFVMGLSSLPADASGDAYEDAFKLAGQLGEIVLIQRAPPWPDFVPNGSISNRTERLTRLEKDLARRNNLKLFLAVDPTDPGDRGNLASVPSNLAGKDFSDGAVRSAFISYSKYLALNYKPAYMAVGVEVDLFYAAKGDAAFRNFQSVYFEAYDAIKSESQDTIVFPTFQYENMNGILRQESRQPLWSLVTRFDPKIDMLAVSSFPNSVYPVVSQLPADYYTGLKNRSDMPVALTSVGWSSATRPGDIGAEGVAEQTEYLHRLLGQSESSDVRMVVWYLGQDRKLEAGVPDPLGGMGLFDADAKEKQSCLSWRLYSDRPAET